MSALVVKAICRRIEERYGSNAKAAKAANVSPGVWSNYCSDECPDTTIPFHRLLWVANAAERKQFAELLESEAAPVPVSLLNEASEATEAAADLQRSVREAIADGSLSPLERKGLRTKLAAVRAELNELEAGIDGGAE